MDAQAIRFSLMIVTTETIEQDLMTDADQDQVQDSKCNEFTVKAAVDGRGRSVYQFEDLARDNTQVIVVVLADAEYELRRTKAGRLVLNK